jgi:hypothetical protein
MVKSKINTLRAKFVKRFFVRHFSKENFVVAYVTDIRFLKQYNYEVRYMAIHVKEDLGEISILNGQYDHMDRFVDNFHKREKKWAEGFMEKILDDVRAFGKGVIDV